MKKFHAILLATALIGAVAGTASAANCPTTKVPCTPGTGKCVTMSTNGKCTQMSASAARKTAAKKAVKAPSRRR